MSIILFLRVLWKRLAMSLSASSIQIAGLWDSGRLRAEAMEDLRAWKNVLLLHPRRETVNNGVVVTRVEHLKDDSMTSGEHEFLRIHVLHEKSKEKAVFIVDRDFWPKDLHGPPERNGNGDSLELETEKAKKQSSLTKNGNAKEPGPAGKEQNHSDPPKKDVPEERGLSSVVIRPSGVIHCSDPFFPAHKVVDRVHRGVKDIEKRMSPDTLELQILTFPECSRPSVINVAFFLAALSEFAPQYHVGEYQACWFAHAALDGLHATFRGRLRLGANIHAMGKWKAASFKYINPSASIVEEYSRQLKEYEDAFKIIQSAGRRLESHQLGVLHEGHRIGVEEGRQEGIEERRKLEEEIEQRMTERRRLEEEIAKLRADLDAR